MSADKINDTDLESLDGLTEEEARAAAEKRRRKQEIRENQKKERKRRELLIIAVAVLLIAFVVMVVVIISREVKASQQEKEREIAAETGNESLTLRPEEDRTAESGKEKTTEAKGEETKGTESVPAEETPDGQEEPSGPEEDTTAPTEAPTAAPTPGYADAETLRGIVTPSWVTEDLLTVSEYSRPGYALTEVNNIVVHYVGNPGTSAAGNREYFESLSDPSLNPGGYGASSHYIVGLEGEIVQCIPVYEVAFANYPRNYDTISIEVCHPDESGEFNETTYWTLVRLCAYLLEQTGMDPEQLIRHYDVSGKLCPMYYVEHPDEWTQFKSNVRGYMAEHPDIRSEFP